MLGKTWLGELLAPVTAFGKAHNVPVWIDQWGLFSNAGTSDGDRAAYLSDTIELFSSAGLHWSYWIWRGGYSCPNSYAIFCGPSSSGSYRTFDLALSQLGKVIGAADTKSLSPQLASTRP